MYVRMYVCMYVRMYVCMYECTCVCIRPIYSCICKVKRHSHSHSHSISGTNCSSQSTLPFFCFSVNLYRVTKFPIVLLCYVVLFLSRCVALRCFALCCVVLYFVVSCCFFLLRCVVSQCSVLRCFPLCCVYRTQYDGRTDGQH
jgi:hypothetical protein